MMIPEQDIIIIGFMGTGKSVVGRKLAEILKRNLMDTDMEIEAFTGKTVNEIFADRGEDYFRNLEDKILERLVKHPRGSLVISAGGGIVMNNFHRSILQDRGVVVWLTATPEEIYRRIEEDRVARPLLQVEDPLKRIKELLQERELKYGKAANLVIETDGKTPAGLAELIVRKLGLDKKDGYKDG